MIKVPLVGIYINKLGSETKVIHETLKEQSYISIFMKRLINLIRTIIKARNPTILEIGKQLAKAEVAGYNSERVREGEGEGEGGEKKIRGEYTNDNLNNRTNYNSSRNNKIIFSE